MKNGLEGMLEFLAFLRAKGISYRIQQQVDDGLEISFDLVGCRVEAIFSWTDLSLAILSAAKISRVTFLFGLISRHWKTG
jgi:hypothetical protein